MKDREELLLCPSYKLIEKRQSMVENAFIKGCCSDMSLVLGRHTAGIMAQEIAHPYQFVSDLNFHQFL